MNRGMVAVVMVVLLGVVVIAIALILGKRSASARVVQTTPAANKWSFLGTALGAGTNVLSSWIGGKGAVSVGGKQVTGQTGDYLRQGVPQTQYGLGYTYGLGQGYGTSGYESGVNTPVMGKDQWESGSKDLYNQALAEGYTPDEAKIYL